MNRLIRPRISKVKKWLWAALCTILFLGVIKHWVDETQFLANPSLGIIDDEIAVVTIEKDTSSSGGSSKEEIIIKDPSKSLWDGLQLLGVPLALAVLGALFQASQRAQDADEAREEVLQLYFDRLSALLVDKNLMAIACKGKEATLDQKELLGVSQDVIRARTLSILRRFDNDIDRKSSVIRFLAEAEIISKLQLDLNLTYLKGAYLAGVNLAGANLEEVNLEGANLEGANLEGANLEGAYLKDACLSGAYLDRACLKGTYLRGANFDRANLKRANLEDAYLKRANLKRANLEGANLEDAYLRGTNLERANLKEANVKGADFNGRYLKQTISVKGAGLEWPQLKGVDLDKIEDDWPFITNCVNLNETNLQNIYFNIHTSWPATSEVKKARNISNKLEKHLQRRDI